MVVSWNIPEGPRRNLAEKCCQSPRKYLGTLKRDILKGRGVNKGNITNVGRL